MLRKRCASPKSTLLGGPIACPGRLHASSFLSNQFREIASHVTYKIALSAFS